MAVKEWKVQVRLEKDGSAKVFTMVLSDHGSLFADVDTVTGPETAADIVKNHLASAEKVFQTQLTMDQGKTS
jgi:hypothetical protein